MKFENHELVGLMAAVCCRGAYLKDSRNDAAICKDAAREERMQTLLLGNSRLKNRIHNEQVKRRQQNARSAPPIAECCYL
jgi:hypothetical protein